MIHVKRIANCFIEAGRSAGEPVDNRKLNGLLFFAQEICRRRTGESLFRDEIEDWGRPDGGPVIWAIYMRYRNHGTDRILRPDPRYPTEGVAGAQRDIIDEAWRTYGGFTGAKLASEARKPPADREI